MDQYKPVLLSVYKFVQRNMSSEFAPSCDVAVAICKEQWATVEQHWRSISNCKWVNNKIYCDTV